MIIFSLSDALEVIIYFKRQIKEISTQNELHSPLNVLVLAHGSAHSTGPQKAFLQIKQQMQTLDNVTDLGVVHGEPNYKDRLNLMNRWNPLIIVPYFIDFGWIVKENCDFIIEERSKGDGGATSSFL